MSMAFSCASARLHGRVGAAKCRGGVSLVRRSSCCLYPSTRRGVGAKGIRAELLPRASADGGAAAGTTSGPAVAVPEAGEVAHPVKEVGEVVPPSVLPEERGKVADVDGSGGNGKFPPGGNGGDGDNGGGGGGG
ncbi:hypothetical protein GUJ93_ZPchr0007g6359 [Zizania palustris]|uniref:Uncharacterized protein n=1 Tax=Zizania palustris TaxID=103762 RepID=A0A8J5VQM2_ZIZPA|nr:hypothetical protein GUJ93_ZPchr0007g6359 [Zizania palustris]